MPYNRVGVCASKKAIGNAVARNRAKRLLREIYRLNRPYYRPGFDMILLAKSGLHKLNCKLLNQEFKRTLAYAGLTKQTLEGKE